MNVIFSLADQQELDYDLHDVKTVGRDGNSVTLTDTVHVRVYKQGYNVAIEVRVGDAPASTGFVSPTRPVLNLWSQTDLNWVVRMHSDSLLSLEMDGADLHLMVAETPGVITLAWIENAAGAKEGLLKARIQNIGDMPADYVVVAECPELEPVVAQSRSLGSGEEGLLTFSLRSTTLPIGGKNVCRVSLLGTSGAPWASTSVDAPEATTP